MLPARISDVNGSLGSRGKKVNHHDCACRNTNGNHHPEDPKTELYHLQGEAPNDGEERHIAQSLENSRSPEEIDGHCKDQDKETDAQAEMIHGDSDRAGLLMRRFESGSGGGDGGGS